MPFFNVFKFVYKHFKFFYRMHICFYKTHAWKQFPHFTVTCNILNRFGMQIKIIYANLYIRNFCSILLFCSIFLNISVWKLIYKSSDMPAYYITVRPHLKSSFYNLTAEIHIFTHTIWGT